MENPDLNGNESGCKVSIPHMNSSPDADHIASGLFVSKSGKGGIMATTGFRPVKGNLKAVIDYADNPDRTSVWTLRFSPPGQ